MAEKKALPPVEKKRITDFVLAFLKTGEMPKAFNTTYQVACVLAVIFDQMALGEMMNSVAHYLARAYSVAKVNVEPWSQAIAEICQDVHKELQRAAEAGARDENAKKEEKK